MCDQKEDCCTFTSFWVLLYASLGNFPPNLVQLIPSNLVQLSCKQYARKQISYQCYFENYQFVLSPPPHRNYCIFTYCWPKGHASPSFTWFISQFWVGTRSGFFGKHRNQRILPMAKFFLFWYLKIVLCKLTKADKRKERKKEYNE